MPHRQLSFFIFAGAVFFVLGIFSPQVEGHEGQVLGAGSIRGAETEDSATDFPTQLETITAFDQREEEVVETIPFETEYIDDDKVEYGAEEVMEEGENGTRTLTYLITFWGDDEIDRRLIDTQIVAPKSEVISKGTKIIWRELSTSDAGGVWYWHKLNVWATKYDANCVGCTGRTYSGTEVKKGVCAVDPRVIKLGTNFYVEGYGLCRAEDIGGAIKGNKIDLGFVDASKGDWGTRYTNIYLITNAPDGSNKY